MDVSPWRARHRSPAIGWFSLFPDQPRRRVPGTSVILVDICRTSSYCTRHDMTSWETAFFFGLISCLPVTVIICSSTSMFINLCIYIHLKNMTVIILPTECCHVFHSVAFSLIFITFLCAKCHTNLMFKYISYKNMFLTSNTLHFFNS